MRRAALALVVLMLVVMVASALAVTPKKSTKFKGTASGKVSFTAGNTFTAKDSLSFKTSSNGKALGGFTFKDTICDFAANQQAQVGTIKVSGGKFSLSGHKTKPVPDTTKDGHNAYWIVNISGKFTSPTKATGTLSYTQKETGTSFKCSAPKLSFTATG